MKRVIVLIVCLILCSFASGSIAEDPLRIQPGDSGTEWRIVSQTNNGLVTQGSSQLYTSYTATCTGETHGVTVSKSYSASISGSFGVSLDGSDCFWLSAALRSCKLKLAKVHILVWGACCLLPYVFFRLGVTEAIIPQPRFRHIR